MAHTWYGKLTQEYWDQVVMSYNGQYQIASFGSSGVYISTDYGDTWSFTKPGNRTTTYYCVGLAANSGQFMVAAEFSSSGVIWVSQNAGQTWTSGTGAPTAAYQVTVSPDASIIYASNLEERIRVSYDKGDTWNFLSATWNPVTYAPSASGVRKWKYGAISADNKYQLLSVGGAATELSYPPINPFHPYLIPASGYNAVSGLWSCVFVSGASTGAASGHLVCSGHGLTNSSYIMFNNVSGPTNVSGVGSAFKYYRTRNVTTDTFQLQDWAGTNIGISGNGTGEFTSYGVFGGRFWVSQNSGVLWNEIGVYNSGLNLPIADMQRCAMSADGQHMVVTSKTNTTYFGHAIGLLFISHDYGSTWNYVIDDTFREWAAVAITPDGSGILAAIGDLGTGSPSGNLWSSTDGGVTFTEETDITQRDWHSLAVSISGTYYSTAQYGEFLYVGGPTISPTGIIPSSVVVGLLFSSGVITTSSLYGSGILTPIYLSSAPNLILREETDGSGIFNRGLFSVTVQTDTSYPWFIYLEAPHASGQYITYTASGSVANQYGFYKPLLELHAGLSDLQSTRCVGSVWAISSSGYITSKLPIYFRGL